MGSLRILRAEQVDEWQAVLNRTEQYDFFHLPGYHQLAEKRGEGSARLFVYEEGDYLVALPLLIRPIEAVPGLEKTGRGYYDATSVYGYAGPVVFRTEVTAEFLNQFRNSLISTLKEIGVVAVFSRLHPLIEQHHILAGLGECPVIGRTVSIDLTLPPEVQFARYRKDHRQGVRHLKRHGVVCEIDHAFRYLDDFVNIYKETMQKANAKEYYYFDNEFFRGLAGMPEVHLFVCKLSGKVICAGLQTLCNGIVQHFLSGTRHEYRKLAPTKLLIDGVRLWAIEQKAKVLHLGGGRGSQEDSLFLFKAGFSDRRHDFAVWRWIVEPEIYEKLCSEKERWNRRNGFQCASIDYFPAYRAPVDKESG